MHCPYCGKEISENAKVCPYCGREQKREKPKAEKLPEERPPIEEATPFEEPAATALKVDSRKTEQTGKKEVAARQPAEVDKPAIDRPEMQKGIPVWIWALAGLLVAFLIYSLVTSGIGGSSTATSTSTPKANISAPASRTVVGTWKSRDPRDGSSQELTISDLGAGNYSLLYTDDGASACGLNNDGEPLYGARASGNGTVSQQRFVFNITVLCLSDPPAEFGDYEFSYTYNTSADNITDNEGTVWSRQ